MQAQRAPLRLTVSPARLCRAVYAGFLAVRWRTILAWDSKSHGGTMPEGYLHLTCEQRCQIFALFKAATRKPTSRGRLGWIRRRSLVRITRAPAGPCRIDNHRPVPDIVAPLAVPRSRHGWSCGRCRRTRPRGRQRRPCGRPRPKSQGRSTSGRVAGFTPCGRGRGIADCMQCASERNEWNERPAATGGANGCLPLVAAFVTLRTVRPAKRPANISL